jgi:hypothetical protein
VADIVHVVDSALKPHVDASERVSVRGPHAEISAQQALGISLALHELATNAIKLRRLVGSQWAGLHRMAGWVGPDPAFRVAGKPWPGGRGSGSERFQIQTHRANRAVLFWWQGRLHFDPTGVRYCWRAFCRLTSNRSIAAICPPKSSNMSRVTPISVLTVEDEPLVRMDAVRRGGWLHRGRGLERR